MNSLNLFCLFFVSSRWRCGPGNTVYSPPSIELYERRRNKSSEHPVGTVHTRGSQNHRDGYLGASLHGDLRVIDRTMCLVSRWYALSSQMERKGEDDGSEDMKTGEGGEELCSPEGKLFK
ncbi:hypothetical protein DPEC_G00292170 [Dallia pectoralis]|uniref:Uncharacterized protein n=1 Tax=Dallia pectoralis TaxID=75939 RepID=A0ACC2FI07_DALPE|nr:hypothetical protein DPEC_G00292170 [Dallia pectoralis]